LGSNDLPTIILRFLLIAPAIILHEVAHGYVAYLLGDPTAKLRGRLTLNPVAHVDVWGTLLMPAIMLISTGYAFGYAKPVPVNPYLMRKTAVQTGMLLTGLAGPVTNILLAVASGLVFRALAVVPGVPDIVAFIFYYFAFINLVLAFFNLVPIPPLDGSRVVQRFLSGRALETYDSIERYGFLIVIGLVVFLPQIGLDPIGAYFDITVYPVARFILGV
jgi:Zn-dependent protease